MALLKADCVDWLALTCNFAVNNYICFRLKYWIKRPDNGCILNIGLFLDNFDTVWNFLSSLLLLKKTELLTGIVLKPNELSSSSLNLQFASLATAVTDFFENPGFSRTVTDSLVLYRYCESWLNKGWRHIGQFRLKHRKANKLTFICNTSSRDWRQKGLRRPSSL